MVILLEIKWITYSSSSSPFFFCLLLSSSVIGDNHKGETLYRWENHFGDGYVWKGFGDKETHSIYKGDVKNGKPNGFGILINSFGGKYVGEWKNGKYWNGTRYYKGGKIKYKYVNGKGVKL